MRDFIHYCRHFYHTLYLVRHVLGVLFVLMLVGAGVISIAESTDFGEALYFTAVTGLTVGYGDIVPTTAMGRVVSVVVGLTGLVFFGIVVAVANRALARHVDDRRQERKAEKAEEKRERPASFGSSDKP